MSREHAHAYRQMITLATVKSTDDSGGAQTATVELQKYVDRSDVEIIQAAGMASRPTPGGLMLVFAVGGDSGHLIGVPVGSPDKRMGHLAEGEAAIYSANGDKVYVRADGTIDVIASGTVNVKGSGTVNIEAATINITGNVVITGGTLTHNGKDVGATHKHGGVTVGAGQSGVPV